MLSPMRTSRVRWFAGVAAGTGALAIAVPAEALPPNCALEASTMTCTMSVPVFGQPFTVPDHVTSGCVEALGGVGVGSHSNSDQVVAGGHGALVRRRVAGLTSGETLHVNARGFGDGGP